MSWRWFGRRPPRRRVITHVDSGITWIHSTTASGKKKLGVEGACTGSARCAGAVHLESGERWLEIHLDIDAMRQLGRLVDDCLALYEADGRPA